MSPYQNLGRACAVAAIAAAISACAENVRELPTSQQAEASAVQAQEEYVIGANDVLLINVWREPELSLNGVEVRLDGKISVPLIDDVQAAGLTPVQLKGVLTERLKEYVTAPQVTVVVSRVGSKNVSILGEVARDGMIPLQPKMRVTDAIAIAGGFTTFAGKSRIKVIRSAGDTPTEYNFDYDAFIDGADVAQNILLLPGDQIIVPEERPFWR